MSKISTGIITLITLTFSIPSFAQNNPLAKDSAIVKAGKDVRFTVLTPRVIRMEWDSTASFTNNASFVVVNRNLPVPKFSSVRKGDWLTIRTEELELKYRVNTGKFTAENLSVKYLKQKKDGFTWRPGQVEKANLKGTYRTLDGFDGDTDKKGKKMKLEDGLLSRDGWHLLDDSQSFLFDKSDWPWVTQRHAGNVQDWYFMGYGHNYKAALADYTKIAGKVPLPPRYAFGYWWSRYWSYSDNELRDLVSNFEKFNVPLDVLVIDMDWHSTDSINAKPDEFGQRKWWTGWTWDSGLFSNPERFLKWTDSKNLKTTLNLHPASGIAPFEKQYGEFARKMNFDTTSRRNIPYEGSNKKFVQNLFDVVLRPMEKQGVDFWWLDWQQWLEDKQIKGLQNTWWLNYLFFSDMERNRDTRPMLYHRWGGLGNHRYQIGFSGDAIISWKSLEFQPYFTNAASNVLYGYWSHDIGGHMFKDRDGGTLEPELYTRWMQYGALSPVFRTHSTKSSVLNKEIWNFRGDYFNAQYDAIRLRYSLVPYIYTMARKTYDTGISLCRPMYYDNPEKQEAYDFSRQYQFGDDILVAPLATPLVNGFAKVKVWLPAGNDWYEWHTGTLLKGGQTLEREFSIDEYPVYVKAGAILPMFGNDVKNLSDNPDRIKLGIFPGGSSASRMYEDNGNDKNYSKEYAYTAFKTGLQQDGSLKVSISPREGKYKEMKDSRVYELTLYGSRMPADVMVNGKPLSYKADDLNSEGWNYNGRELSVSIVLPQSSCTEQAEVLVRYPGGTHTDINNGIKERFKRLTKATTELKFKEGRSLVLPNMLGKTEETNRQLEYSPEKFEELIRTFNENYNKMPEIIKPLGLKKETESWYLGYLGLGG
ncbi:alpha-glucosidase (family GH31 glycosyl hydrolase) [Arcticibacter tournemirensis]|nr:glycoside hydrolase family 31 protein [Arcticibacter tournemirensis]TQM52016.1 alpha-glucosidase (family GH31 glycosyl hydrolase) [Arcticibacter tournemirensis]